MILTGVAKLAPLTLCMVALSGMVVRQDTTPRSTANSDINAELSGLGESEAVQPTQRSPMRLGVGIHLGSYVENPIYDPRKTEEALKLLKISRYRDDIGWSYYEENGYTKKWPRKLSAISSFVENTKTGLSPIFVLTAGDPAYNGGLLPTTPKARERFSIFASEFAAQMSNRHPTLEIWNEWNLGTGTRSKIKGSAASYVELAQVTYSAIKKSSNSTVLVGAIGGDYSDVGGVRAYWPWLNLALSAGLERYSDGLSIHLYNICGPEEKRRPLELIKRLDALDKVLKIHKIRDNYPIYITEVGWPTLSGGCGFRTDQQVSYSAQFLLWSVFYSRVKEIILYELKDSITSTDPIESHFGILDRHYRPKPYTCGIQQSNEILIQYVPRKISTNGNMVLAVFQKGNKKIHVVWRASSLIPAAKLKISSDAREMCSSVIFRAGDELVVGDMPIVIEN
jgi:hypothetical protein